MKKGSKRVLRWSPNFARFRVPYPENHRQVPTTRLDMLPVETADRRRHTIATCVGRAMSLTWTCSRPGIAAFLALYRQRYVVRANVGQLESGLTGQLEPAGEGCNHGVRTMPNPGDQPTETERNLDENIEQHPPLLTYASVKNHRRVAAPPFRQIRALSKRIATDLGGDPSTAQALLIPRAATLAALQPPGRRTACCRQPPIR
jgi:hypothetical protein